MSASDACYNRRMNPVRNRGHVESGFLTGYVIGDNQVGEDFLIVRVLFLTG